MTSDSRRGIEKGSFAGKVSLNLATNVIRTLIMAVFGFLMVPYYIDQLGIAAYAVIPLSTTIAMYVLTITEPLGDSFARYIAVSIQEGDMPKAKKYYSSAAIGLRRAVLALIAPCILFSIASPYIFNVGGSASLDVQLFFAMVLVSSVVLSYSASMDSVFVGYNKLYISYVSKIVYTVLQVALVVLFFILSGPSLVLMGVSYVIATIVMLAIMKLCLMRQYPDIKVEKKNYDRSLLKDMGSLALWATISDMGALLFIQASMILVNIYLGAEDQSHFSIVANMISMINTATSALTVIVVPLAYQKYAEKDFEGVVDTMCLFTKFVGLAMAFPIAFILIFMQQILGLWLGPGYDSLYDLLWIMLPIQIGVTTVRVLMFVPIVYARMKKVATYTIGIGIFNIALTLAVLQFASADLDMVAVCWAISMLIVKVGFYPIYCSKITGANVLRYLRPLVDSHIAFAVTVLALYGITSVVSVPISWIWVLGLFGVLFGTYTLLILNVGFSEKERMQMSGYLPGPLSKILRL